jgi:tetratricopeptide (TPR) repeat protein
MMKRVTFLTLLTILLLPDNLFSQARIENKLMFYEAESWILFEDYKEALQQYLRLNQIYPTNSNYKYRIGQCYTNIPGQKEKAVSFLEEAVKNINPRYKEGNFKETGAPYDALYYLANAYRINNQLDKALDTYKEFRKNLDAQVYDTTIVNQQIQSCYNAQELMAMPLFIKEQNLGENINESNSEYSPVISDDENIMVFSRNEAFYDAIMYATKTEGKWNPPLNMNELLKVDYDYYPTSISADGKTIYMYSSADYDGVISSSTFKNDAWSPPVRLNDNINTKYWESHATISHDSKKLYFTSNRKGTIGGLDIYVSSRDSSGDWGAPVNLGAVINTPYNEETPFLSQDDKTLFFSSRGHFNMGGYDVFYSTLLDNGEWSVPLNVGYPLNSTDDDVFFKPVREGYEGYFARYDPNGFGDQDIYKVQIFSEGHPRQFLIRGFVKVADLVTNLADSIKVSTMNIKNPNQTIVVYSNPKTGEYEFTVPQGNYEVTYEIPGSETVKRNIDIPITFPSDSFIMPGTVLPKTDFVADLSVGVSQTIAVQKGDSILFPLKVEPNSELIVEHWLGDSLIKTEHFAITDTIFNYKFAPLPGNNMLTFKLTDRYNNTAITEILIQREAGIESRPVVRPEYSRVIARKQATALKNMMTSRADSRLKKIIGNADTDKQEFGKVDDLISYFKEEAAKNNISTEEIDRLALKTAVMDNVLTQAAVDLLAKYAEGTLKKILEDLDIYKQNLNTWTDLQMYITAKTNGEVKPEDLNLLAGDILAETDPAILVIREKLHAYSENTVPGTLIRKSVALTDEKSIKKAGKWLQSFYNMSLSQNMTDEQIAQMFAVITTMPKTKVNVFAGKFAGYSDESLSSWIKTFDVRKENIKSPSELILYILRNKDKLNIPDDVFFRSLAKMIASENIPSETIRSQSEAAKGGKLWILWVLLGGGLIFLFFIIRKKNKKEKK